MFVETLKAAETAQSKGCLKTSLNCMERALALAQDSAQRALAAYQCGSLLWGEIGDGSSARNYFEQTVKFWKQAVLESGGTFRPKISLLANAAENMMILSLSFDEYERWTEELRREAPKEPILHEQVPMVLESREKGQSWSEVMILLAMGYVNQPGGVGGGSHPASGACIFQLLLRNRRQLRLSRPHWRAAILGYTASISDVLGRADDMIYRTTGRRQPEELAFAQQYLRESLAEFCAENPNDAEIEKGKELMDQIARTWEGTAAGDSTPARPRQSNALPAGQPLNAANFVGPVVFLALGLWPFLSHAALGWKILGSLGVALGGLTLVACCIVMHQQRMFRNANRWRRNSIIDQEVGKRGLSGLAFRLASFEVGAGDYLYLNFRPSQPVSEEKCRAAHMALRSIVALSLPRVASRMTSHQLVDPGFTYTIGFGAGVEVPFYELQGPYGAWSTLQVGSEVDEDIIQICIHPTSIVIAAPIRTEAAILQQAGDAFMIFASGNPIVL